VRRTHRSVRYATPRITACTARWNIRAATAAPATFQHRSTSTRCCFRPQQQHQLPTAGKWCPHAVAAQNSAAARCADVPSGLLSSGSGSSSPAVRGIRAFRLAQRYARRPQPPSWFPRLAPGAPRSRPHCAAQHSSSIAAASAAHETPAGPIGTSTSGRHRHAACFATPLASPQNPGAPHARAPQRPAAAAPATTAVSATRAAPAAPATIAAPPDNSAAAESRPSAHDRASPPTQPSRPVKPASKGATLSSRPNRGTAAQPHCITALHSIATPVAPPRQRSKLPAGKQHSCISVVAASAAPQHRTAIRRQVRGAAASAAPPRHSSAARAARTHCSQHRRQHQRQHSTARKIFFSFFSIHMLCHCVFPPPLRNP
jgi:hypothetical protein